MRAHRWVGLGTAEFTAEQASEWATLDGVTDAPLTLNVAQVVCLICDSRFLDTGEACPGPGSQQNRHRWVSLMTLAMTTEDAERWADPEQVVESGIRPRSTNLLCVLCGQPYEQAEAACPERTFWLAGEEA